MVEFIYCTFQVRLSRLPADISEKQSHQGSPQRKPKPASPSRTPVEKTSLGSRELSELLAKELNRKKDITKKVKSLGSAERKTMKQLKALAKPVLGTTAVETVLSPTKTTSTLGQHKQGLFEKFTAERTPEKPTPKPVDKPTERVAAATEKSTTKERVDSPAENSQSELSAEEALVQESMIQAMLQQHSVMQQLGQSQASLAAAAALASASTGGGLDSYNPYLHPMWSMYSPTFAGSGVSGLPMMDPGTAAAFGYLPGMAGYAQSNKTPSPTKSTATSGKKQSSGSATSQAKKTSVMQEMVKKSQVQGKKSSNASVGVKKTPTSLASSSLSPQQGVKRPHSPAKAPTSLVVPKFSSGGYPPAKRSAAVPKPQGETKGIVKVAHGVPHMTSKHQQSAVRGLAQRGRGTSPSGQPYRKPVASTTQSMTSKLPGAPRHGTTVSKPAVGAASQPRKVPVYPVDEDLVSPPRRVPPPAHGGTGAGVRRPGTTHVAGGMSGLDFSRPTTKPRPPPSPPSSDDDVIVLDDSD